MPERFDRVAVTGASGIVGRFVVADLLQRGIEVRALSREPDKVSGYSQAPDWVQGSLGDLDALRELCMGADALVHCAFEHVSGRYRGGEGDDPTQFWSTNLVGTVALLETARQLDVRRVVLLSSRAVFGSADHAPEHVGDDVPPQPDTHYGALKVALESLARSYLSTAPEFTITSLRPTGVYGLTWPVTQSKWFEYVQAALAGEPITAVRTATEVHGADVAAAIALLLQAPPAQVCGRAYNCSDLLISTRDIAAALADITGSTAPLPQAGPAPRNQMTCEGLADLGWKPGGRARFEETLHALLNAAASY